MFLSVCRSSVLHRLGLCGYKKKVLFWFLFSLGAGQEAGMQLERRATGLPCIFVSSWSADGNWREALCSRTSYCGRVAAGQWAAVDCAWVWTESWRTPGSWYFPDCSWDRFFLVWLLNVMWLFAAFCLGGKTCCLFSNYSGVLTHCHGWIRSFCFASVTPFVKWLCNLRFI